MSKYFETAMKHLGIFCLWFFTRSSGTTIEVRYRFVEIKGIIILATLDVLAPYCLKFTHVKVSVHLAMSWTGGERTLSMFFIGGRWWEATICSSDQASPLSKRALAGGKKTVYLQCSLTSSKVPPWPPPLPVCENDSVFTDQFIALLSYHRVWAIAPSWSVGRSLRRTQGCALYSKNERVDIQTSEND